MPFTVIVKRFPTPEQEETQTKDIQGLTLRIGRGTDNELHLEDHTVQLHHAVIQEVGGAYVFRDLSAVSLSAVNGKRTKEALLIGAGGIAIGPYVLRFSRPTPKAPLCIEYESPIHVLSTSRTLVGEIERPAHDPDATMALRLPNWEQAGDPDATRILPALRPTGATRSDDPDATRALPAFRPPAAPQTVAGVPDVDKTMALSVERAPAQSAPPEPTKSVAPVVPAPPAPVAPLQQTGVEERPPSLPTVSDDQFAEPAFERPAILKIPFAAAYRLEGRFLNKATLSVVGAVVVLGIAAMGAMFDSKAVLMPGEVSAKHASFVNECVRCHLPTSGMRTAVPDSTCVACHKSPMHFGDHSLAEPLACTACHMVHKGNTILASTTGNDCLRCHADLKVTNPTVDIHRSITDFGVTHPEFAVMVKDPETGHERRVRLDDADRLTDQAKIKLNHKLHLDPDLPGLASGPLQCVSCHQASERKGYLMPPVTFDRACAQCHALTMDSKFPDKTVPHGRQPRELDLYLKVLYTSLWPVSDEAAGGKAAAKEKVWIAEQVEKAEEKLFGKKGTRKRGQCQLCHMPDPSPLREPGADDRFTVLAATAIPGRWFLNSNFNHAAHTMEKCIACHDAAPQSEATTDVLLPKVKTCRACHDADGTASPSCLECHLFHEIPKPKQAQTQKSPDANPPN